MRPCRALAATAVIMLAAGCGSETPEPAPPEPGPSAVSPSGPARATVTPTASRTGSPTIAKPAPSTSGGRSRRPVSGGWEITVYYTAVERFHDGEPAAVTGCRKLDCSHGDDDLGRYPDDFVQAVRDEGTGLTRSGRYLNWSYDVGFWLDAAPRSSDGRRLVPFVSAAADPGVLAYGTRFAVAACGRQEDGSRVPAATCTALRAGAWRVTDEFTPGLGGDRHIDAYIGAETGPGFTDSDWYVTLKGARLTVG